MKARWTVVVLVIGSLLIPDVAWAQQRRVKRPRAKHVNTGSASSKALGGDVKLQLKAELDLVEAQILDCNQGVPIKFQRKVDGEWDTLKTDDTNDAGIAKVVVADKTGKYRAVAPLTQSQEGFDCFKDVSPVLDHDH